MLKQDYFLKLLDKKPKFAVISKDILSSGMFLSSNALNSYIKNYKGYSEYKEYALVKDGNQRNLGPGRYPTPQPPKQPSFTFSITPRFQYDKYAPLILNRSATKLKVTKSLPKMDKAIQSVITLREKSKKKKIEEIINKKTKEILNEEKRDKILTIIKEKHQRAEYRKHAAIKDSICLTLSSLLIFVFIPNCLHKQMIVRKRYKQKINKLLRKLSLFTRVIGKLKILGKKVKLKHSWKIIKKHFKTCIKNWRKRRDKQKLATISYFFERFQDKASLGMITKVILQKVLYLQKRMKRYLIVLHTRIKYLQVYWDKFDKNYHRIPTQIKVYFIRNYIKTRLNEYYFTKNKEQKLKILISQEQHEEIIEELFNKNLGSKQELRIFDKKSMLQLIKSAYNARKSWKNLVPDYQEKEKKVNIEEPSSIQAQLTDIHKSKNPPSPIKRTRFATPNEPIPNQNYASRKSVKLRTMPPKSMI